jgi:hypothetical protein
VTTTKTQGGPGSNVTITNGTNDVNEQGTQVPGVNFGGVPGTAFPYTTTIDGQNFYSFSDLPGGPAGSPQFPVTFSRMTMNNSFNGYGTPGPAGQSYGNFNSAGVGNNPDYTLANAFFSNSSTGSFALGNLILGHRYLVQFWVSDPRGNGVVATRFETISSDAGGDNNTPTLLYQGPGSIDGQWVTGTFVAGASLTEQIDLTAGNSNPFAGDSGSPQINLLQLRDLTAVPEPASLTLTALGALGLLARRRRA